MSFPNNAKTYSLEEEINKVQIKGDELNEFSFPVINKPSPSHKLLISGELYWRGTQKGPATSSERGRENIPPTTFIPSKNSPIKNKQFNLKR